MLAAYRFCTDFDMLTHLDKGCRIVQPHLGLWWLFRGQSAWGLRGIGVEGLGSLGVWCRGTK